MLINAYIPLAEHGALDILDFYISRTSDKFKIFAVPVLKHGFQEVQCR